MRPLGDLERDSELEPAAVALSGGEDYELCFATRSVPTARAETAYRRRFRTALTRIGRVVESPGLTLVTSDGARRPMDCLSVPEVESAAIGSVPMGVSEVVMRLSDER